MKAPGEVIARAESVLIHPPSRPGQIDPRWLALIEVSDLIERHPGDVWPFILRWGSHPDDEVRAAVAACLLEHLLEYHFDQYFPQVQQAVTDPLFADTFSLCWKYGQSEIPGNSARFDGLIRETAARRELRHAAMSPRRAPRYEGQRSNVKGQR
jgi:hypothetical protein